MIIPLEVSHWGWHCEGQGSPGRRSGGYVVKGGWGEPGGGSVVEVEMAKEKGQERQRHSPKWQEKHVVSQRYIIDKNDIIVAF